MIKFNNVEHSALIDLDKTMTADNLNKQLNKKVIFVMKQLQDQIIDYADEQIKTNTRLFYEYKHATIDEAMSIND